MTISQPPPLPSTFSEHHALAPTAVGERIDSLDILRGIALFGILLMNIEALVGPLIPSLTGVNPALRGADLWADTAIYLLVQGKFYVIFSLLFGMGFALMQDRAETARRPFLSVYLRRLTVLLILGLMHALLVWSGDILTTYALVGFALALVLRELPTRWMPMLAVPLLLMGPAMMFAFGALGWLTAQVPEAAEQMQRELARQAAEVQALVEGERAAYGVGGSYGEAVVQRMRDTGFALYNLIVLFWQVLGLFVLGAWYVRSGAIRRPDTHPRFHAVMRWGALPAGAAMVWWSYRMLPTLAFDRLDLVSGAATALQLAGSTLMGLGYLSWMLCMLPALRWAAPAGRMALTNYLMQSAICTLIFYGYGLGYFERLPRAWQPAFVFVFFLAQVAFSHWWLRRFRFGPMEWVWRGATYGRLPALRRE